VTSSTQQGAPLVTVAREEHIAIVRLNRPEALNAISGALADELTAALHTIAADSDVWAIVLAAAGDKAFCVGADLKERSSFTLEDFYVNRKQVRGMFEALRTIPQPSVAAVFGFALGGGFELALSCDLVVAAEGTKLGLPEVRVGLLPAGGGTQLLTRKIGTSRAKDMIFRGKRIDAAEAHALGVVVEVTTPEALDARALEVALDICRSSPIAVREAKRAIDQGTGVSIDDAIELENDAWKVVIETEDRREGIAAFVGKRDPAWKNR
jgi:enoyl-CoA hydratase/carnithine racemase